MYGILFNPEKYISESKHIFPATKKVYISKIHPIHKNILNLRNEINDICKMIFNIMFDFYSRFEYEWNIIKKNLKNNNLKSLKECVFYNCFFEYESNEELLNKKYNININNISSSSPDELALFIYNFYFDIKDIFRITKDKFELKNNSIIGYSYIEDLNLKLNNISFLTEQLWTMLVKKVLKIIELKRELLEEINKNKSYCFIIKNNKLLNIKVEFHLNEIKKKPTIFLYLNRNQKDNKFLVTYCNIEDGKKITEYIDSDKIIFIR